MEHEQDKSNEEQTDQLRQAGVSGSAFSEPCTWCGKPVRKGFGVEQYDAANKFHRFHKACSMALCKWLGRQDV